MNIRITIASGVVNNIYIAPSIRDECQVVDLDDEADGVEEFARIHPVSVMKEIDFDKPLEFED